MNKLFLAHLLISIIILILIIYIIIKINTNSCSPCSPCSPCTPCTPCSPNSLESTGKTKRTGSNVSNASNASTGSNVSTGKTKRTGSNVSNKESNNKFKYDYDKCMRCIDENNDVEYVWKNCPHCRDENYDRTCLPPIQKHGKINNCIPLELGEERAYKACVSTGDINNNCDLRFPDTDMLDYQKEICKRKDGNYDFYCAYDETDSCSLNQCSIDDYYSYGPQSNCDCQKVIGENLPEGIGRECIKGKSCKEYSSLFNRDTPELINDPQINRFMYNPTWLYVPNVTTDYGEEIITNMIA